MRTDSHTMLGSLCLLTDLRNYVRVRAQADGTDPADEFARVFPDFVWVVRDFRLQDKQPISADEYLDQILRPQFWLILQGNSKVQHCLRNFFPHHKMFMLERPVAGKDMAQLEMLREDQLQPRFRQQEEAFCQHIWKEAPVKMLLNGSPVTGRMLACLVETYVADISNGSVPCVESVHTVVAEAENNAAVEAAAAEYRRGMEQDLVLPTASLNALMAVHQNWKKHAITFFLSQAFDKTEQLYQALLMDKLEVAKEEFCWRNEKASEQRCCELLKELWGDMELRMQRGDYMVPGGMWLFKKDLKRMQEEYKRRPNKGVKAEEVLEKFLREKGLEMTETWIDRVDQQCKAVLAEATAATQAVEKQLQEQQQQQQGMLAEGTAAKKAMETQLQEQQQQQQGMLAEGTAAKKAMETQLQEQQQQQQGMLAEGTAAKKAMETQLQEQQQQQQGMLAEGTAAKKAMETQLQEQQQQQQGMLAEGTAAKKAMETQLQEQQQQQQGMLAEGTAAKKAMETQLQEQQQQQQGMLAEGTAAKKAMETQLQEQQQQQQGMLAEGTAAKKAMETQLQEQQQQQQGMLAEVTAAKKVVKKQLEEQQQQQQVTLAKVTAAQEAAEARLEERQQQVMLAEVTVVMKVVERQLEERWQQWTQQLQEEQSLVLSQRLEELEVRLQEGHGREAAALQQVELTQEEEQTVPSWRSTLLKFLDKVVVPILIRVVNSIVNNAA
uniref:GB1/RHD3-type G domain-containing protein n=1 Tax=Chrysolophus pictus TaxID=9089 RepID=A0A8C3LM45_CHRPC